jgi:TPR repeat protein
MSCFLVLTAATYAATPAKAQPAEQKRNCSGSGAGLSTPPTAETLAAIAAHEAASSLSVEELYVRLAKGDAPAAVELGLRYSTAKDLPINPERALPLYEYAARQGNPLAFYYLGHAHTTGFGVPKDDVKSVILWEEASLLGYGEAQYSLGFMIANGRGGIEANWCAAIPLFEAAAAQDQTDAAFMLGVAYHTGRIGDPDYQTAAKWYRKAYEKVLNQKAQYNMRMLIESYLVEWQEGDPGKPAPPRVIQPTDAMPEDSKPEAKAPATNNDGG